MNDNDDPRELDELPTPETGSQAWALGVFTGYSHALHVALGLLPTPAEIHWARPDDDPVGRARLEGRMEALRAVLDGVTARREELQADVDRLQALGIDSGFTAP